MCKHIDSKHIDSQRVRTSNLRPYRGPARKDGPQFASEQIVADACHLPGRTALAGWVVGGTQSDDMVQTRVLCRSRRMTDRFPPIPCLLFPQYRYFCNTRQYVQYVFDIERYLCDTYGTRNIVFRACSCPAPSSTVFIASETVDTRNGVGDCHRVLQRAHRLSAR